MGISQCSYEIQIKFPCAGDRTKIDGFRIEMRNNENDNKIDRFGMIEFRDGDLSENPKYEVLCCKRIESVQSIC